MKNYSIRTFGDLLREAEPLAKAQRPPGGGWRPVGKKGGFRRDHGATAEYWYPDGSVEKPSKAGKKSKPARAHTLPGRLPEGRYKHMDPIESTAIKDSAKWRLETGQYQLIRKRTFSRDLDEHQRRKTVWAPHVDDQTKLDLIRDYQPLVASLAKKLSRQFHLPFTATVRDDLHAAGIEGLLVALDRYRGGTEFVPTLVVKDMMRLHAAREFLGFELPEIHARNLARYIAARHQASRKLDKMDPTPEEVLPFFDLRKRHVHVGLPAYDESRPIGKDPQTKKRIYAPLRNEQVPEHEGYTLPEYLGRKGVDEEVSTRKRKLQPSKLDWAEMYHNFLTGQKGVKSFETDLVAPGAGIGYGFSVEDQIVIRHDLQEAAMTISEMGPAMIKQKSYPGAKTETSFRVKDLGDVVMRRLGVDQEEHSVPALVRTVPIEKKTKDGWKRVGDRQAHDLMQKFVEMGLRKLPKHAESDQAKRLAERCADILAPQKLIPKGPSWMDIIKEEAQNFSAEDVEKYRKEFGAKEPRVDRMSEQEIRIELAKRSKRAIGLSEEMKRAMTASIAVERISPQYGIATRFDPETGSWESAKVRMKYQRFFKKSFTDLTDKMVRDMAYFPNLMTLVTRPSKPTLARASLDRMIGLL